MIRLIIPLAVITLAVWLTIFMLSKRERKEKLHLAWQWGVALGVAALTLLLISLIFHIGSYVHG